MEEIIKGKPVSPPGFSLRPLEAKGLRQPEVHQLGVSVDSGGGWLLPGSAQDIQKRKAAEPEPGLHDSIY